MRGRVDHAWDVSVQEAVKIQRRLRQRIVLKNALKDIRLVAGADVAVDKGSRQAFAAAVVLDFASLRVISKAFAVQETRFPYVSGLLSFREGPALLQVLRELRPAPDLVIFDGQGVAHPRGLGIAAHLGVLLDIPTVGCAKSRLVGEYHQPEAYRGVWADLVDQGQTIGAVLRTKDNVNPVFVSPGHKVDLYRAVQIVLACCRAYRLPEPTRQAHIEAGKLKRRVLAGAGPNDL